MKFLPAAVRSQIARVIPGGALVVLGAVGGQIAVFGGSLVPIWALAIVAGFLLLVARWGTSLAAGAAVIGFFTLELGLVLVAPSSGVPLPTLDGAFWGFAVTAVGISLLVRPPDLGWLTRRAMMAGPAAAVGALAVTLTYIASHVLGHTLAWGMNGDSANVVGIARRIVASNGITFTTELQPTPLPLGMIASNIASGRDTLPGSALLRHDVMRLEEAWLFAIAVGCVLSGIAVARFTGRLRPLLAATVIALSSCIGITWYAIGVQFQHGFVSTSLAIAILLASWLIYLSAETRPLVGLAALCLAAVCILATWSPLVTCVAALALIGAVLSRQVLRGTHLGTLALAGIAPVLLLVYAGTVTLPQLLAQSEFLAFDGGFPGIGPASVIVIAIATALLGLLVGRFASMGHVAAGAVALVGGFLAGLIYLVLQRTEASWGYYPAKFAWTVSILMLVISVGLTITLVTRFGLRSWYDFGILAVTAAGFVALLWAPAGGPQRPLAQLPLLGIITGESPGMPEKAAEVVFALAGRDDGRDVVWRSTVGDAYVNYWLLQVDAPGGLNDPVRPYAYLMSTLSGPDMCRVVDLLGPGTAVHTPDPSAAAELTALCGDAEYQVVVSSL